MGTAERRLEILKYLCKFRKELIPQLAEMFGVSIRTIQQDISEIEATFHVPLDVRCGKYDGGVYVIGDYSFDRVYIYGEEIALLCKMHELVKHHLTDQETSLFKKILKKLKKCIKIFNADSNCLR